MSLGAYLRKIREDRQLSLRDVERLAKEGSLGADVSSGYLSMLERDGVKGPSPRFSMPSPPSMKSSTWI